MAHAQPAAPVAAPNRAPYEADLQRLSEIMGALHYLRELCGAREGQAWRNDMQALVDAEAPSGERRERLVASFNLGYRGFQQTYRTCTPAANFADHAAISRKARRSRATSRRATRTSSISPFVPANAGTQGLQAQSGWLWIPARGNERESVFRRAAKRYRPPRARPVTATFAAPSIRSAASAPSANASPFTVTALASGA